MKLINLLNIKWEREEKRVHFNFLKLDRTVQFLQFKGAGIL